ncbi:hypothetical protein [Pseudomonas asiatica]|uniref:hypothetical protein n=1 Tax=Pseudomonas asiatica TaxID=2219225 RepID=UPI0010C1451E|nr:hypothetical protein [Pseudomonas asiatica]
MDLKKHKTNRQVFACILLVWFCGSITLGGTGQPIFGGYTLFFFAAALMGMVLRSSTDRITKGLSLVGMAVMTTLIYTSAIVTNLKSITALHSDWVLILFHSDPVGTRDFNSKIIGSMIDLISLAAAGAGGSIMAVEGERYCVELPFNGRPPSEDKAPQSSEHHLSSSIHLKLDGQAQLVRSLETTLQVLTSEHRQLKRLIWICAGSMGALVTLALVTLTNH